MGTKLVALVIVFGALWDFFTTFRGVAEFFDLAMEANLNPAQFTFALIVTLVIFGFVIATHFLFSIKSDDLPTLMLKAAWAICIVIDLYTSWRGTKHYVFEDYTFKNDPYDLGRSAGLLLVTFLIVASTILLSRLLLAKDIRGNSFLF